jgi:hypothetical protein
MIGYHWFAFVITSQSATGLSLCNCAILVCNAYSLCNVQRAPLAGPSSLLEHVQPVVLQPDLHGLPWVDVQDAC